ncbi:MULTISPECIES: YggT family protein [Kordiimonas]|uniref:YggT family protein n=1 Tax=Kordiimonas TaxID=288021 RepID=UPI00082AC2BD
MDALLQVSYVALDIFKWMLIISIILGWLIHFGVVNAYQPFVQTVGRFLHAVTEPALKPIRRFIPTMGGMDISPIVLFLLIMFLQRLIINILYNVG